MTRASTRFDAGRDLRVPAGSSGSQAAFKPATRQCQSAPDARRTLEHPRPDHVPRHPRRGLRSGAHQLADGARTLDATDRRRLRAFRTYFYGYAGEVLAHHTIEDDYFFPALAEQVGAATARIDRLARDHADLDEIMTAVTAGLERIGAGTLTGAEVTVSLRELAVHMDEHLDFEDEEILPRFERHFSVESYEALEAQAQKSLGIGKQAAFTIPFVAASVTPELREQLLGGAPAPMRILYRMTKGRHARLTVAAFGSDAVERGLSRAVDACLSAIAPLSVIRHDVMLAALLEILSAFAELRAEVRRIRALN